MKTLRSILLFTLATGAFTFATATPKAEEAKPNAGKAACCIKAEANEGNCQHGCCVAAAKDGRNCEKCGGKNEKKG